MGNVPFRSAPARIPETLDQFSTDLISLDRFGSKGDIAGRRYVRPRVVALVSKRLATGVL
jgi:hypothetical protein